jgi:hypothetical protein
MPSDYNKKVYILPKLSKGNYNTLMKLISNSLKFDLSDPAKFRLHVLDHYFHYGWKSTIDAFGVKKSTLYDWRKVFITSKKQINSLVPKSTRPNNVRQMTIDPKFVEFIKSVREEYGNVSKYKLKIFVDEYAKEIGVKTISVSLIGKIIKRKHFFFETRTKAKRKKFRLLSPRIKRTPKETLPGYLEMDSIIIYLFGRKYCFSTIIDIVTKFAWCKLIPTLSSNWSKQALIEFRKIYKHTVRIVQTDNGSEFLGEFNLYLESEGIKHEFIYPRSPKINGVIERFNRTIQEEFLERQAEIDYDLTLFNQKLTKYLIWYNTKRPHQSLNYMTPKFYTDSFPKCM